MRQPSDRGPAAQRQRPADQSEVRRRSATRSAPSATPASRRIWTSRRRRTKSFASRRPPPTSRTSCPKARRSTCGPRASASRRLLLRAGRPRQRRRRADHVRARRPGVAGLISANSRNDDESGIRRAGGRQRVPAGRPAGKHRRRRRSARDPTLNSSDWTTATTDEAAARASKKPINWLSGESRWIVIGSQSGRVVTIENAFVDPLAVIDESRPPCIERTLDEMRNAANPGRPRVHSRDGAVGGKVVAAVSGSVSQ